MKKEVKGAVKVARKEKSENAWGIYKVFLDEFHYGLKEWRKFKKTEEKEEWLKNKERASPQMSRIVRNREKVKVTCSDNDVEEFYTNLYSHRKLSGWKCSIKTSRN